MSGIELTEELFKREVAQRVDHQGLSFILAVYAVLDEFVQAELRRTNIILACGQGCSLCCHQLVTCTEMEADAVCKYINELGLNKKATIKKLKIAAARWQRYYQLHQDKIKSDCFAPITDWLGKPCCFLSEKTKSCLIYPVRIIDCRTYTSELKCVPGNMPVKRFRFECEEWANNFILDRQKELTGNRNVTPLIHWMLLKILK